MAREMKDSGQGWLDQIPCTWDMSKVSLFFDVQLGKMLQPNKSQDTDTLENYICAANVGGNTLKLDSIKSMWFSTSEKTALKIHVGDLLVVEGGDIASCDIASQECDGLLFQNSIHRVRPLERSDIRFLKYVLWTAKSRGYIDLICNKATIAHFSKDKFLSMPYPVAPYTEQVLIVDFLDRECAEIDAVLAKTRASIEEYKKLKQAVITQAVTKGVRGDRPMKDSGIEWIGEIPEEWSVERFSRVASVKANLVDPANYLELPQVSPENIEKSSGRLLPCRTVGEAGVISWNHLFLRGQILYSKIRPKLNKVCVAPFDGLCSADMYPIETDNDTRYVMYLILSDQFLSQVSMITEERVKMPKINQNELASLRVALPATLSEQEEVSDYLDKKCAEIDNLIDLKQRLLIELEKYKKALIFEYVTGKKEV